jgi:1-acyl-sn-glycerol-3-phosphate acyltransferase
MPDFYPPLLTPALVKPLQWVAPWLGRWCYRLDLVIEPACLERLHQAQPHRLLFLCNHPTFNDIITIFLLSARLQDAFHYWAAYERFKGKEGWLLQRLGAYSLRRGLGDRASVAQTLTLLMQPHCRLVVFPEGGCTFQNDIVSPFRPGALQIALQAMSRVERQQGNPDLLIVPVSIKYRYQDAMDRVIDQTLKRLETALDLSSDGQPYARLRTVAEAAMTIFEQDYRIAPEPSSTNWNERIERLKAHVLQSCEATLGLVPAAHEPTRERVYKIQYMLEQRAEELAHHDFWTYDSIYQATARLLNFDAIYDGYVAEHPTPERFLDTLTRLERAVFNVDQPTPKGDRQVFVKIGQPIPVADYLEAYQQDKTNTVAELVAIAQSAIQHNLDCLSKGK